MEYAIMNFGDIMFLGIISSKVKEELDKINFKYDDVVLVRVKDDKAVLNVYEGDNCYLLKYYSEGCFNRVQIYREMEKFGIKMVKLVGHSNYLMIYENVEDNDKFECVDFEIFKDEKMVVKLAEWYSKFMHFSDVCFVDYCGYFKLENIKRIMSKFNLDKNYSLRYILDNFNNIKLKLSRLEKCVVFKEFCLDNLVYSKELNEIIMNDCDDFYIGYKYMNVKSILNYIDENYKRLFLELIGGYSKDEEAVDKVVSCVNTLYLATEEETFPVWAKTSLEMVNSSELLDNAKNLVEWY